MEDNYNPIDRHFKKLLEDAPPMSPNAQALADMERRLDGQTKQKRRGALLWWFWLLPASLLFSSLYFYSQYHQVQKNADALQIQLNQVQNQLSEIDPQAKDQQSKESTTAHIYRNDGTQERNPERGEKVIHHYDTIYQTVERMVYLPSPIQQWEPSKIVAQKFSTLKNNTSLFPLVSTTAKPQNAIAYSPLAWARSMAKNKTANLSETTPLVWTTLLPLSPLGFSPLSIPQATIDTKALTEDFPIDTPDKLNPLVYFIPTGVSAGLGGGAALSFAIPNSEAIGGRLGANVEVVFRKNWRMGLGANWLYSRYTEENNLDRFPQATPENPLDQTKELYLTISYLELPVYFRYFLQPEKKWNPFIQLGLVTRKSLMQEFRYEFINSSGEYYATIMPPNSSFALSTFQAGMGVSFPLGRHLKVRSQLLYKQDWKLPAQEYLRFKNLDLDLGLQYDF